MKKLVLTTLLLFVAGSVMGFSFNQQEKAAIIDLSGTITPTESSGLTSVSGTTPEEVRKLNRKALNQGADAIIYEINSGGGAVVASKEIYRSINDVNIPTVCRMRDVAASGGYLLSLGCDRIVADSSTLTGSIGVKSSYIQYAGVLDRLGADYVNISAGERKEIGNPFMNSSEEEKQILKDKVDIIQEDFLDLVKSERNLTEENLNKVSSGEPFLGSEAEKISLIDETGGRASAIEEAENLTESNLRTFNVATEPGFDFISLLTSDLSMGNFLQFSSPFRAVIGG
ncbi:MAG: S49 family peptidase [Candidatus Nanohaloarchaea archaeon]